MPSVETATPLIRRWRLDPNAVSRILLLFVVIAISVVSIEAYGATPTCMLKQDYENYQWSFDSPFGPFTNNSCPRKYAECDPTGIVAETSDCNCTCICRPGRAGWYCNETVATSPNPFGLRRTVMRRFWTSSLQVNGTLDAAYRRVEGANKQMPGWTIEFWLLGNIVGARLTPGMVFAEFREPKRTCVRNCKNGDSDFKHGEEGTYLWSFIVSLAKGQLEMFVETLSNGTGSFDNVDYVSAASRSDTITAGEAAHYAITMRRVASYVLSPGYANASTGYGDSCIFEMFKNGNLILRYLLPHRTDFEKRPLFLGPWDARRFFEGRGEQGRVVSNEFTLYRRDFLIYGPTREVNIGSFDGVFMDEVRIWSRALTEEEIVASASHPLTGNETDLMVYYNFDDADPYLERNKATRYAGLLNSVHARDSALRITGDEDISVDNNMVTNTVEMNPLSQAQPAWAGARGDFAQVPESLFPLFEKSFVSANNSLLTSRQSYQVYHRGVGSTDPNAPPIELIAHAMNAVDDKVYLLGGRGSPGSVLAQLDSLLIGEKIDTKLIFVYDVNTEKWLTPLNISALFLVDDSLDYHTSVVIDKTIYWIGSVGSTIVIIEFNTASGEVKYHSKPEWSSGSLVFDCFGGGILSVGNFAVSATLTVIDVDQLTITYRSPRDAEAWPVPRMSHMMLPYVWAGTEGFVMFGGGAAWQQGFLPVPQDDHWFYNTTSESWRKFVFVPSNSTMLHLPADVVDVANKRVISVGGIPYKSAVFDIALGGVAALSPATSWRPLSSTIRTYYIDESDATPRVLMETVVPDSNSNGWLAQSHQVFGAAAALFTQSTSYHVLVWGGISLAQQLQTGKFVATTEPRFTHIIVGCISTYGIDINSGLCEPCQRNFRSLPIPGRGSCSPCPEGTFSPAPGTECRLCPEGSIRRNEDGFLDCRSCAEGLIATEDQSDCIPAAVVAGPNNALFALLLIPIAAIAAGAAFFAVRIIRVKREEQRRQKILGEAIDQKQFDFAFLRYEDLDIGDELGSGSFGSVYRGTYKGQTVAIKVSKPGMVEGIVEFLSEAQVMMSLSHHDNVTSLVGVCTNAGSALVVLEFVSGGSLDRLIHKGDGVPEDQLKTVIARIVRGLKHLHEHNLIHRDLACRNILLDIDDDGKITPKISDFGMSRVVEAENKRGQTATQFGPVPWMAPEAIGELKYSPESDIWSLGVTLWEMVTRQDPSKQMALVDLAVAIRDNGFHPKIPAWAPDWLRTIWDGCWRKNPDERMSLDDILTVLGAPAEEKGTENKRKTIDPTKPGSPNYSTLDPKKKRSTKMAPKDKGKKADPDEELASMLSSIREQILGVERKLQSALERNNELRAATGQPPRAPPTASSSSSTPFAPPQAFAPPSLDGDAISANSKKSGGWRRSHAPSAGLSNTHIQKKDDLN